MAHRYVKQPNEGRAILRRLPALEGLVCAALAATALAILYRDQLTKETMAIGPEGAGSRYFTYSYDDRVEAGKVDPTAGFCPSGRNAKAAVTIAMIVGKRTGPIERNLFSRDRRAAFSPVVI